MWWRYQYFSLYLLFELEICIDEESDKEEINPREYLQDLDDITYDKFEIILKNLSAKIQYNK